MIRYQAYLGLIVIIETRWSNENAFCCIQAPLLFLVLIILLNHMYLFVCNMQVKTMQVETKLDR